MREFEEGGLLWGRGVTCWELGAKQELNLPKGLLQFGARQEGLLLGVSSSDRGQDGHETLKGSRLPHVTHPFSVPAPS